MANVINGPENTVLAAPSVEKRKDKKGKRGGLSLGQWYLVSIVAVFVLLSLFVLMKKISLAAAIWTTIALAIVVILGYAGVAAALMSLGKRGLLWVIVPFNRMMAILKMGQLYVLLFSPSPEMLDYIEWWCGTMKGKVLCRIIPPGKSALVWIGYWKVYTVLAWWLFARDKVDPEKAAELARHSVSFGDETWVKLSSYKDEKGKPLGSGWQEDGVPTYETGDPAEIAMAVAIYPRAWRFDRVFSGVKEFPGDAIWPKVLDVLRYTLADLKLFTDLFGKAEEAAQNAGKDEVMRIAKEMLSAYKPEVLRKASDLWRFNLGITRRIIIKDAAGNETYEYEYRLPILEEEFDSSQIETYRRILHLGNRPAAEITSDHCIQEGTTAHYILKVYGFWLRDAKLVDLEELSGIRDKLAGIITQAIDTWTQVVKATGESEAEKIHGMGDELGEKFRQRGLETDPEKMKGKIEDYAASPGARDAHLTKEGLKTLREMPAKGRQLILVPTDSPDGTGRLLKALTVGKAGWTGDEGPEGEGGPAGEGEKKPAGKEDASKKVTEEKSPERGPEAVQAQGAKGGAEVPSSTEKKKEGGPAEKEEETK